MLLPHSQKHVLCLLFCILTPQLLPPRRIRKRGILRMGTARICHVCVWGQRRKSTRAQLREGRERPSRGTPGASQGLKKGGDQGAPKHVHAHTHNHEILLGQCWTGMSHREMPEKDELWSDRTGVSEPRAKAQAGVASVDNHRAARSH